MTDEIPDSNVIQLADAVLKPTRRLTGRKVVKEGKEKAPAAGAPKGRKAPPSTLPDECPVKALGKLGLAYYFLDRSGQFIDLQAKDLGRLNILALFGTDKYLVEKWPAYDKDGEPNGEFKHGRLGPVLIESCELKGLFDPAERVRGPGTWADDDGNLIFHCGDVLWATDPKKGAVRVGTGLHGRYLYPGAPPLPEPLQRGARPMDQADKVLDKLATWNFARGEVDAMLALGFIGCGMLGAAPAWRAAMWVTGRRGCGKSSLLKFIKWLFGDHGMISSADATRAGIAQRVANSSRPVAIDELEASDDNRRAKDIIGLARIASSGDDVLRGSPGGQASSFTVRNCFLFSSIIIPPLRPADRSRLAILEMGPIEKRAAEEAEVSGTEDSDHDPILGDKKAWAEIGRQLRARLMTGWPRYKETFALYRRELIKNGHDPRGADQFGALGAAYDLLTFDALVAANAVKWAAGLPAKTMAETSGAESDESECLAHLMAATPQTFTKGSTETVAHHLRMAKADIEMNTAEDKSDSMRTLAKIGIKLNPRFDPTRPANEPVPWEVAIANTHDGLARLFQNTQWASTAGSSSAWPQMFKRLPGADFRRENNTGEQIRLRIDGQPKYVTILPWATIFPPMDLEGLDRDEKERVPPKLRPLDGNEKP